MRSYVNRPTTRAGRHAAWPSTPEEDAALMQILGVPQFDVTPIGAPNTVYGWGFDTGAGNPGTIYENEQLRRIYQMLGYMTGGGQGR